MQQRKSMEAYEVSIATTSRRNSQLIGTTRKVRYGRVFGTIKKTTASIIALVMSALVVFSAVLAGAAPATAGLETDFNTAFCSEGVSGLGVSDIGMLAAPSGTAKDHKSNATAYEKYGLYGTSWSSYIGFSPMDEKGITTSDGQGMISSRGIIAKTGGDSRSNGMQQWEDATHKDKDNSGLWNNQNTCSAFGMSYLGNSIANAIFWETKFSVLVGGWVYQASVTTSDGIFSIVEAPMETIITTMKNKLYFNYLIPMVMLAALWMAWVGMVKKRTTDFISGLIWLVVSMAVSVAFLSNPMFVPKTINNVVGQISQGGAASITSMAPKEKNMCSVGSGKESITSDANVRAVQCNLWYSFVYTPWVIGQFGESPDDLKASEKDNPNGFLQRATQNSARQAYVEDGLVLDVLKDSKGRDQTLGRVSINGKQVNDSQQSWALYLLDNKVNVEGINNDRLTADMNKRQMAVYANQLGGSNYNKDFRGESISQRYAVAVLSSIGASSASLMILILGISIIIMDLGLIMFMVMAPLFCLAALHPGAGRRMAMQWIHSVINISMKRIAISLYLAVSIALLMVVVQGVATAGFITSTIMVLAMVIASLFYRKQIMQMFDGFQVGQGLDANGKPDAGAGRRTMGALGAVAGLVGGNKLEKVRSVANKAGGSGSKSEASNIAGGGAGDKPKGKTESTFAAIGGAGGRKESQRRKAQEAKDRESDTPNESSESTQPDHSGAGAAPAHSEATEEVQQENVGGAGAVPNEQIASEKVDTNSIPTVGKPDTQEIPVVKPASQHTVGEKPAGNAPEVGERTTDGSGVGSTPAAKPSRLERKAHTDSKRRIEQKLRKNGYRNRATVGNVLWATTKGVAVGAATGNARVAMRTTSGHMTAVADKRQQQNAEAVSYVRKDEKRLNSEHEAKQVSDRQKRALADREFAKEVRANEQKATQPTKRDSNEPVTRWTRPDAEQVERPNAAPTVAPRTTDSAPSAVQKARENAAPAVAPRTTGEAPAAAPTTAPATQTVRGNAAPTTPVSGKHGKPLPKVEKIQDTSGTGRRVAAPATPTPAPKVESAPKVPAKAPASAPVATKVESSKSSAPKAPAKAPAKAPTPAAKAPVAPKVESSKPSAPKAPAKAPVSPKAASAPAKASAPKAPAKAPTSAPKPPQVTPPKRTETPKPPAPKLPPKRGN